MDARTVKDTEFGKVLDEIRKHALSPEGRDAVVPELVTADRAVIEERYLFIDSIMALLEEDNALNPFPSITHILEYVKKTHGDLEGKDVYLAGEFLSSYMDLLRFLKKEEEIVKEDEELKTDILSSLSPEGDVNENHPRLLPLIRKREEIKSERYRYSSQYIQTNRSIVQNENPLYKNERVVIPIVSSAKRADDYYISGQSGSGSTLFAEPFPLVELNNQVVLAEERIRLEKQRILHELSEKVRALVPALRRQLEEVVHFDIHYVFALWARKNKARHPQYGNSLRLLEARHPLLGAKAVPVTVELEEGTRVLVLSGANAGGKTVTMKTVALLSLLNQTCGFVTANELSVLPIFDYVWTDIGDGQSIEEAASTFSSHMTNISRITRKSTRSSLVILDELGSGTDPEEGAVLSVAVLRYLSRNSFLTICTSHYAQVKNFAYSEEKMMNASMEFDEKTSLPTYRVLSGIPGDSHAISTAKRSGMPKEIIEEAQRNLGEGNESSARIITSLLSKSRTLDKKISQAEIERRGLENKRKELEEKEEKLKGKLLELEKEGHRELNDYLRSSRSELENLVKDVRTGKLTKEKTKKVKAFISEVEEKETKLRETIDEKESEVDSMMEGEPFRKGDEVLCGSSLRRGVILEERGRNRYYISLENGMRMEMKGNLLKHAKPEKKQVTLSHFSSETKKAEYEMDVRGLTMKETEERLDDQMEAAVLRNMTMFSIIHGFGDGILQRGVHEYLKKSPYVEDYRFALPEDGGMGKTYVKLKFASSGEAGRR